MKMRKTPVTAMSIAIFGCLVANSGASDLDAVVEQLRSILPEEQREGLARFEENRSLIMTEAMARMQDGEISESDIESLLILLSPWQRGLARIRNHRGPMNLGNTERPTGKPSLDFQEREEIVNLLRDYLSKPATDTSKFDNASVDQYCRRLILLPKAANSLGELVKSEDFERIIALLESTDEPSLIDAILPIFETWHALPNLYPSSGLCGNSSVEEVRRFKASELERAKKGRSEVLAWHRKYSAADLESRVNAAIETYWLPRFAEYSFMSQFHFGGPPTWTKLESLIRQGDAALPLYQKRFEDADDLLLAANYAVIITMITGKEDDEFVRKLFASEAPGKWEQHATFATEIILAAHSKRWMPQLVELQSRPYYHGKTATEVLARCHLHDALPQLASEFARNPNNHTAKYAIEELEEWK